MSSPHPFLMSSPHPFLMSSPHPFIVSSLHPFLMSSPHPSSCLVSTPSSCLVPISPSCLVPIPSSCLVPIPSSCLVPILRWRTFFTRVGGDLCSRRRSLQSAPTPPSSPPSSGGPLIARPPHDHSHPVRSKRVRLLSSALRSALSWQPAQHLYQYGSSLPSPLSPPPQDCHPEQLFSESKFLCHEALQELTKALTDATRDPRSDGPAVAMDDDSTMFLMELLVTVAMENKLVITLPPLFGLVGIPPPPPPIMWDICGCGHSTLCIMSCDLCMRDTHVM